MNATQWAAWVGASSGLGSLLWNVYTKVTSGPRLQMTVSPGMKMVPPSTKDGFVLLATVRNVGTAPTTLTKFFMSEYPSWWGRVRQKHRNPKLVMPRTTQPLPHKLEVGCEWSGWVNQNEELNKIIKGGNLWCLVYHSFSKSPVMGKVIPK